MNKTLKSQSIHTLHSSDALFYIGRTKRSLQKLFTKKILDPLPKPKQVEQNLQKQVSQRKIIRTVHAQTQSSALETQESEQVKSSLFTVLQSSQFQSYRDEERSKRVSVHDFNLECPMKFKKKCDQKIFTKQPRFKVQVQEIDQVSAQVFLKKLYQIVTTSQAKIEEFNNNDTSFISDNVRTQLTSPIITFTNQLSIIPIQSQQTNLKTATTGIYQIMDAMDKPIEKPIQQVYQRKKQFHITIIQPDEVMSTHQFTGPDYGIEQAEVDQSQALEYSDNPKHVLRQAIQQIQSHKKISSKFSRSILKIIGVNEEECGVKEDCHISIYNQQKTRRYLKLYLQNKMQRIFSKLEETILIQLDLIIYANQNKSTKIYDTPSNSRFGSVHTNQVNTSLQGTFPSQQLPIKQIKYKFQQFYDDSTIYHEHEEQYDQNIFIRDFDEDREIPLQDRIIECCELISIPTCRSLIYYIISGLDDNTRNKMLSDKTLENNMFQVTEMIRSIPQSQDFNVINHKVYKLAPKDKQKLVDRVLNKYNELLSGYFEDEHEIQNMQSDYPVLEFEAKPKLIQQDTNTSIRESILVTKAIKPRNRRNTKQLKGQSGTVIELSPPSDYSNKSKNVQNSPKNSIMHKTVPNKGAGTLLEATLTSTSVQRGRSDSQQNINQQSGTEETSLKNAREEISNTNTTQSKQKETIHQHNVSLKESISFERYTQPSGLYSMTKHSLLMRTHLNEAARKQAHSMNQQIESLISEHKFNELIELFSNNPNIMINERCSGGNTYLIIAAQTGAVQIVELILQKGASPNLTNSDGDTAMHIALAYNYYQVADLLVQYGAIQNIKNHKGLTPWQMVNW